MLNKKWYSFAVLIFLLTACDSTNNQPATQDTPDLLKEVRSLINKHSIYDVSDKELTIGALKGMVQAQNDPYSHYYSREESILQKNRLAKERIGLGIQIMKQGDRFVIVEVQPGTSAADHGIQMGDEILAVNNKDVKSLTIEQLVYEMSGKKDTTVHVKLLAKESREIRELQLNRKVIPQHSVEHEIITHKEKKYGYLSISVFGEGTFEEWQKATQAIVNQSTEGIIVDLRGNPGGYLGSVVPILDSLLPQETPLLWMENSKGELELILDEEQHPMQLPIVVLQDKGSASASEVMIAALIESNRAVSIGSTTYGKGTVQETFDFSNESSLKLTTKKWLTPNKQWIHGKGIEPTVEIKSPSMEELLKVPETEEQWKVFQEVLGLIGYSSELQNSRSIYESIAAFQRDNQLPPTGSIDSLFLLELQLHYKKWLETKKNDEAIQLALDYFQHSD